MPALLRYIPIPRAIRFSCCTCLQSPVPGSFIIAPLRLLYQATDSLFPESTRCLWHPVFQNVLSQIKEISVHGPMDNVSKRLFNEINKDLSAPL